MLKNNYESLNKKENSHCSSYYYF